MSEPAADTAASAAPSRAAPPPAAPRRRGAALLVAAAAVAVIVGLVAASPFWAPAAMRLLPWSPAAKPVAPDPALVQAQANAAALQQLAQRFAALEARPAPDLSGLQQQLAAISAKPPPDLVPLQARLDTIDQTIAELKQQVAALDKAAQQQPPSAADAKSVALSLVLLQIRDAVDIGRPFEVEYQTLAVLARDHADLAAAAAPLAGPAKSGVASRAALAERLRQLAPQIATAAPPPAPDWRSQVTARLRSLVTIRRIGGATQSPAEAAVSAAERAIAGGDLAAAIDALSGLSGPHAAAAAPWLKMARDRLAVEAALRQLATVLTATLGGAAPASGQGG